MSRHIFNLIDHGTNMAGVGVRKGMSRQGKVPTEKEIQNIFDNNPNIKPPQPNAEARHSKDTDRDLYTSNRKQLLRNEGEAAASKVAEKFPFVATDAVNEKKLPLLRDFFSRQTTLPEHLIDLQTEGNWQNEDGSIKEGAIPPVNALRRMNVSDIANIGRAGDEGLVPLAAQRPNNEWEKGFDNINHTLPVSRAGFVMPADKESYLNTVTGNTRGNSNLIAIRGFGAPQDKAFKRKPIRESKEGIYTAPIPPERLVGAFRNEVRVPNDLDISEKLRIADEVREEYIKRNNVLPFGDELADEVKRRVSNLSRFGGKFENKPLVAAGFDDLEIQDFLNSNKNQEFERFKQEKTPGSYDHQEPWMYSGTFGLNNPILTDEEKNDYITQIKDQWELTPGKVNYLNAGQMQSEGLPNQILYPNVAGANQNIQTGEPMEIIMQLLKQELQEELDQRYTQLPQEFLPTAQQIQDSISEAGIARTPQEFEETEVLGGKNERARQGYTAKRYLNRLGTEGALAEGIVRRDFPLLNEFNVDATKLPVLRDYISRQTTLPEHDLSMQTEGPHFDEYGNILPGAIPPVNAVKKLGAPDIQHIGSAGNFGLKPVKDARVNFEWERSTPSFRDAPIDLARRPIFPVGNAGFVSPINALDVRQAEAGNIDPRNPEGFVAIRGFGAPSDKAFSRKDISEGREGIYTAPIPPERLVGIHRKGGLKEKDLSQNIFTSIFDDENIAQQINLPDNIPKRDFILNEMRLADLNNDSNQFAIEMDNLYELGEISEEERNAVFGAFENGRSLQRKRNREQLPEEWSQGSFGFNNPILTPEEKEQYRRQVLRILSETDAVRNAPGTTIPRLQDYLRQGHSPVLNPRPVKKALPRHWSNYFDTVNQLHEFMRGSDGMTRVSSLEDLKNLETPANDRLEVQNWELDHTGKNKNMKSLIPGIAQGEVFNQDLVDEGVIFGYPANRTSFSTQGMADLPPSTHPQGLVFIDQKPDFHATPNEGRVQTEGTIHGGISPDQAILLTDPTKPINRKELAEAGFSRNRGQNWLAGVPEEFHNEPRGLAEQALNKLPQPNPEAPFPSAYGPYNPWGAPRTVDDVFQLSEPMDIAMRLLKMPIVPNSIQRNGNTYSAFFEDPESGEQLPIRAEYKESDFSPERDELYAQIGEGENRGIDSPNIGSEAPARSHVGFKTAWGDEEEIEALEDSLSADEDFPMMGRQLTTEKPYQRRGYATALYELAALAAKNKNRKIVPSFDLTDEGEKFWGDKTEWPVRTGEPMNIAFQLLKERVSPEAKRHKLEYDKKYESSPERVKYREDLNRERRRRGIYGSHNHQDVSHTEGGKLTLEGEHENRARHFKDKGTLRHE